MLIYADILLRYAFHMDCHVAMWYWLWLQSLFPSPESHVVGWPLWEAMSPLGGGNLSGGSLSFFFLFGFQMPYDFDEISGMPLLQHQPPSRE